MFLALAGCASVAELKQELNSRQSVASSLEQLDYRPLASEVPLSIKMNEQQAYLFPSGKSFAAGLEVPDAANPHKLEIKSYLTSSYIPSASVFVPRFLFLDAQKHIVGDLGKYRLVLDNDFWKGSYFRASIVVPASTAFIVMYTDELPEPSLAIFNGNGVEYPMPHAPSGSVTLSLSKPFPPDHDFSSALIKESVQTYSTSKADFFVVTKIQQTSANNSLQKTLQVNAGRGLVMTPVLVDQEIAIQKVSMQLMGRTHYAAPILTLTNKVYEIKGEVEFTPEANKVYLVKGVLSEDYSAVWLEEEGSGKIMGNKIEKHGSTALGILEK
jgi:hypothetical protein